MESGVQRLVGANELHALTLKGKFLTFIARGEASVPFEPLVKQTGTYLRKKYVSPSALRALLDEVWAVGVEGFRKWKDCGERTRRFEVLNAALTGILVHYSA